MRNFLITLLTFLMILVFALSVAAQKGVRSNKLPSFSEDTAMYPHDFNDDFYAANGVVGSLIDNRLNGMDFLSVFSASSNPAHRNVRVLVTLPAYDENGALRFWTPLGDLGNKAFTEDRAGAEARDMAMFYPIYVFPKDNGGILTSFTDTRQAALIDESQVNLNPRENPLGLRIVYAVSFTDKAFNTKEGFLMMQNLEKKNGLSLDGTPIIRNKYDIEELAAQDFISAKPRAFEEPVYDGMYTIAPLLKTDKLGGLIAPDAFLILVTRDARPLPGETIFQETFNYLQKLGMPYDSVK